MSAGTRTTFPRNSPSNFPPRNHHQDEDYLRVRMAFGKELSVTVIGSTGYAGSHTCIELLARGHHVTGVSRNP